MSASKKRITCSQKLSVISTCSMLPKSENEITESNRKKRGKKVRVNDATPKAKKPKLIRNGSVMNSKLDGNGCLYERPSLNFNNLVTLALKNSPTGTHCFLLTG